jgi:hypothetical protein
MSKEIIYTRMIVPPTYRGRENARRGAARSPSLTKILCAREKAGAGPSL